MHHVVIIGSGFAGIKAAKELDLPDVQITLISKTNHHLFQPMIYQVATGLISPAEVAPTNRDVLKRNSNTTIYTGEVTDVDPQGKTVIWESNGKQYETSYDILIVATGSETSYFGNNHYKDHTYNLKTLDDALVLKAKIFSSLEAAEIERDEEERNKLLTFVIVGAGPIGLELCGQMNEIFQKSISGKFSNFTSNDIKLIVLEGAPHPLPPFGEELGNKAAKILKNIGVSLYVKSMVTDIGPDSVTILQKDEQGNDIKKVIPTKSVIWSAGVQATPLAGVIASKTGAEQDRPGKIKVNDEMNIPGYLDIFVLGDVAQIRGAGLAQGALQSAAHAADIIKQRLKLASTTGKTYNEVAGKVTGQYVYNDKGSLAVISKLQAVMKSDKLNTTGGFAWLVWSYIHLANTVGFRSKINVGINWIFNFLTSRYNDASVTPLQINAKQAQKELEYYRGLNQTVSQEK